MSSRASVPSSRIFSAQTSSSSATLGASQTLQFTENRGATS